MELSFDNSISFYYLYHMKIDTTIFNLADVFNNLNHSKTWQFITELRAIKAELESSKNNLMALPIELDKKTLEVITLEQQLVFLNRNIKTVEEALMAHERNCFDKWINFEKLSNLKGIQVYGLN